MRQPPPPHRPNGDYAISYAHSARSNRGPTDYDHPSNHRGSNPFFRPSFNKPTGSNRPPRSEKPAPKTAEELDKELDKYLMSKKD